MISMTCVKAMPDDIVVFRIRIIARHGQSESDLRISMRYVFSLFEEYVDDETPRVHKIAQT